MANKFKVGDKVKINCTDRWYSAKGKFILIGHEFRIIDVCKPRWPSDEYIHRLDQDNEWRWSEKELEVVKPKFNIKDYPGKYTMHCNNKESVDIFCKYLDSVGEKWFSGDKYTEWSTDNIEYMNFNRGTFSPRFCLDAKYTVLEFEDFDWSDFEMKKEFTKADLKNGDVVKLRDGAVGFAIVDIGIISFGRQKCNLINYRNDLTNMIVKDCDIVAIRRPCSSNDCTVDAFNDHRGTLIYERKEVEEMTLEEVCKALGKEIKIVKK